MPTSTFFRLSKEKQEKLLEAAKREFSRVPFAEASINKIIQEVGIPRGSFYMYFEDKEDLYAEVLKTFRDRFFAVCPELLTKNGGNLKKTFLDLFDFLAALCLTEENRSFFRNAFYNMSYQQEKLFFPAFKEKNSLSLFQSWASLVDFSTWNEEAQEAVEDVFSLHFHCLLQSFIPTFFQGSNQDEAKCHLKRKLSLLEQGILK